MPNKLQFQKTNPKFEIFLFDIVWKLAFGVWPFAPTGNQPDLRLKQKKVGAC